MKLHFVKNLLLLSAILFSGLLYSSTVRGEDVYAPLIEEGTEAIIRADVNKISFTSMTEQATKIANSFIDELVEKKEERQQTKAMLPMMLSMMTVPYSAVLDNFKKAGVSEFYIVGNSQKPEICPAYLAFPAKDLNKEQQSVIKKLTGPLSELGLKCTFRYPFFRHGFVIIPVIAPEVTDDTVIKNFVKERFGNLKTVKNDAFNKAFAAAGNSSVYAVVSGAQKSTEQLIENLKKNNPAASSIDKNMEETLIKFLNKLDCVTYNWDLEKLGVTIVCTLKSSDNISELTGAVDKIAEAAGNEVKKNKGTPENVESTVNVVKLFKPEINGSNLTWKIDTNFIQKNKKLFIEAIKMSQTLAPKQETKQPKEMN